MNDIVIKITPGGGEKKEEFDIADVISTLIQANITLILMQFSYTFFNMLQQLSPEPYPPYSPGPAPPQLPPTPPGELAEITNCYVEVG